MVILLILYKQGNEMLRKFNHIQNRFKLTLQYATLFSFNIKNGCHPFEG